LNGALRLDDVELLSAKQIRLTGELFCEWRACLPVTCYLLMMNYVSVSLFYISVSSSYFAHFVAHLLAHTSFNI